MTSRAVFLVWISLAALAGGAAGEEAAVRGRVVDPSGAAVSGAAVRPFGPEGLVVRTDASGAFSFAPGTVAAGRLTVEAEGFVPAEADWATGSAEPVVVVLGLRRDEAVTVTASRGAAPLAETPARVVLLDRQTLNATPALTVDDALRQVPGFTLFRRAGSRVANPTAQGVSQRGVGPSGSSRALVLLDGLPLNDPFGGWVYWSRLPRAALDRVEVVEGGASELYGSAALGGVVQALFRTDDELAGEASAGNEGTGLLSAYAARRFGAWSLRFAGEAFTTDGYVLPGDEDRGPVDTPAGSSHLNGVATVERRFAAGSTVFARVSVFGESRENGTPLQVNDTDLQEVAAGADLALRGGSLVARGFYGTQSYRQTFTAVSADRTSESLTRRQRVPAESWGGSLSWSRAFSSGHGFVAGIEARGVSGRSDETAIVQGRATSEVSAGGDQSTWAVFGEGRFRLGPRLRASLGARLDRWSETDGRSLTTPLAGSAPPSLTRYEDRQASAVSPRAALHFRASERAQFHAAAYGAFRGPTLNELYRSFRVGDTLTLANPGLTEERLQGAELGATVAARDERARLRIVAFAAGLDDPVANVTERVTPALVTRERQNLGSTRSRGLEADLTWRFGPRVSVQAGYAYIAATVRSFAADPSLEGNDLPQVPRHQATLQAVYTNPRVVSASVLARASSRQFDDDQNRLPLAGYFTLDAQVARRLGPVQAFVAAENLTGVRYEVGRTPVLTLGPPRLLRAGLRFGR